MGTKSYILQGTVKQQLSTDVGINFIAHQCAVSYYPDGTYTAGTEVTPSAGTVTIKGRTVGASDYDVFSGSPIDCTVLTATASARGIVDEYQVVPAGIVGATHYKVTFVASETN